MISFSCDCEKGRHAAPLEEAVVRRGAVEELPRLLRDYPRLFMVCDETTYRVLGTRVEDRMVAAGHTFARHILRVPALPDEKNIGDILIHLTDPGADADPFAFPPLPDMMLAVGSGVCNDITRLISYRLGIPYTVCGTAPSMDGYASAGSPILFDGTKKTIKCTTPRYIVADLDVMREAPWDMLLAGIGDMFGKYTGILDWELSRDRTGEYFCEKIAADVLRATDACLENGYALRQRDPATVGAILDGFLVTGLSMTYTGNSRPASGAEHIIAHAWELYDVEAGRAPNLHGLEVCEATRIEMHMYRMLWERTEDERLRALIAHYLPAFERVERFTREMEMPLVTTDRETILRGMKRALSLRDRYTVLKYLAETGDYDRACAEACDRFLASL